MKEMKYLQYIATLFYLCIELSLRLKAFSIDENCLVNPDGAKIVLTSLRTTGHIDLFALDDGSSNLSLEIIQENRVKGRITMDWPASNASNPMTQMIHGSDNVNIYLRTSSSLNPGWNRIELSLCNISKLSVNVCGYMRHGKPIWFGGKHNGSIPVTLKREFSVTVTGKGLLTVGGCNSDDRYFFVPTSGTTTIPHLFTVDGNSTEVVFWSLTDFIPSRVNYVCERSLRNQRKITCRNMGCQRVKKEERSFYHRLEFMWMGEEPPLNENFRPRVDYTMEYRTLSTTLETGKSSVSASPTFCAGVFGGYFIKSKATWTAGNPNQKNQIAKSSSEIFIVFLCSFLVGFVLCTCVVIFWFKWGRKMVPMTANQSGQKQNQGVDQPEPKPPTVPDVGRQRNTLPVMKFNTLSRIASPRTAPQPLSLDRNLRLRTSQDSDASDYRKGDFAFPTMDESKLEEDDEDVYE